MPGLKWVPLILLLFSFCAAGQAKEGTRCPAVQPETEPFWRRKEKIAARIKDERYIAVAVNTRKPRVVPDRKKELYLLGAGLVNAPLEFAYAQAQRFDDYPKMSAMIKSSKYDPGKQQLAMTMEAFKYRADLRMKIDRPPGNGLHNDIRFCVLDGAFAEMGGLLRLEKAEGGRSQISLTALQGFDKLPVPAFFLEFGLEMALQIAAGKMRGFVEEAYRNEKTVHKKEAK